MFILITVLLMCLILGLIHVLALRRKIKQAGIQRYRLVERINEIQKKVSTLEKERESLRENLTKEAIDFYEEELQYMGAEIHDNIIQRLAEFRLTMHKLDLSEDITELQATGLQLKNQFPDIVRSVQRISRRLLPDNLVAGSFTNSIRALCFQKEKPGSLIIRFESTGNELPIPGDHALHLYRIVQELIHNTIKHSLAWHLTIRVLWTAILMIEIEDDGQKMLSEAEISNSAAFRTIRMRALKSGTILSFSKASRGMLVNIKYDSKTIGGGVIFK